MLKRHLSLAAAAALALSLAACGNEADGEPEAVDTASATPEASPTPSETATTTGPCSYPADGSEPAKEVTPPSADPETKGKVAVTIETSAGELTAELDRAQAPCTVNNFVSLAEQDWFDDTDCHRLTTAGIFVLQCGDPTATGTGGPGYTIPDEVDGSETYPAGTVAMAKTVMPDSGGSQFFLVYEDTPLPPEYTVFGRLDDKSVRALQDIAADGTAEGTEDGPPATPVTITDVTVG